MKKRGLSLLLALLVMISVFPMSVFADEEEIIRYEDGSYLVITRVSADTRASGTKTGSVAYKYYDNGNELEWEAVLNGTFSYNGTTSTCTAASCSVTVYDDAWYLISKSVEKSGNTATAEVTMGHRVLGITVSRATYDLSLTCDKNGNLS